jgi:hypothetical protein
MKLLLSMHYQRQWLAERGQLKPTVVTSKESVFLMRKYVIKGLLKKRMALEEKKLFKMKRYNLLNGRG